MRKNMQTVINAFVKGEAKNGDSKRTCWTNGRIIYSYRTPIAFRAEDGTVFVRDTWDTPTTAMQISAIKYGVDGAKPVHGFTHEDFVDCERAMNPLDNEGKPLPAPRLKKDRDALEHRASLAQDTLAACVAWHEMLVSDRQSTPASGS